MAASGPISPKRASISSKRLEPHRDSKQSGRALALHRRQMNADVECVSGRKLDGILARSWSTSVTVLTTMLGCRIRIDLSQAAHWHGDSRNRIARCLFG